jgi:3-oxoacyl-[acyl-carrier protein] reductase
MAARYALVTGASGGIGAAVAEVLAERGFDIILNSRAADERIETVKRAVEAHQREVRVAPFDVRDAAATQSALRALLKAGLEVDVIVNNAGVARDGVLLDLPAEDWDATIRTTLDGFFNVTKELLLPMVRRRHGRVVNISSIVGLVGNRGQTAYAAAKAGLIGATRSLAREVASHGVTVNAVAPGVIDTIMTRDIPGLPQPPIGRPGTAREVASLVAFLASDDAAYITGQVITIDGGLT